MSSLRAISTGSCSNCVIGSPGNFTTIDGLATHVSLQRSVRSSPINAKSDDIFRRELFDRNVLAWIRKSPAQIDHQHVSFFADLESSDRVAFSESARSTLCRQIQRF